MNMEIYEILSSLRELARQDPKIRDRLIETKNGTNPVSSFCSLARDLGYPLYDMDLISAGEDYYAAMRRSTNGGGENSPMLEGEDDYYELFISELRSLR